MTKAKDIKLYKSEAEAFRSILHKHNIQDKDRHIYLGRNFPSDGELISPYRYSSFDTDCIATMLGYTKRYIHMIIDGKRRVPNKMKLDILLIFKVWPWP